MSVIDVLANGSFGGGFGAGIGAGFAAGVGAGIGMGTGGYRKTIARQLQKAIDDEEISIRDKTGAELKTDSLLALLNRHDKEA